MNDEKKKPFCKTIPGILAGIATAKKITIDNKVRTG